MVRKTERKRFLVLFPIGDSETVSLMIQKNPELLKTYNKDTRYLTIHYGLLKIINLMLLYSY
jgi:hypothetical protein